MGKPLSAAHKAAISKALRDRNKNDGGSKSSSERRKERRANRTPEQVEASRARRAERRSSKKDAAEPKKADSAEARFAARKDAARKAQAGEDAKATDSLPAGRTATESKPSGGNTSDPNSTAPHVLRAMPDGKLERLERESGDPKIQAEVNRRRAKAGLPAKGAASDTKPSGLNGKDVRSMSDGDKVKAAETMFGTGSKQHRAAIDKARAGIAWADPADQARAAARAANPPKNRGSSDAKRGRAVTASGTRRARS